MQTLAVISVQNVLVSKDVQVFGDLRFQQRSLLPSLSVARDLYDYPVVNWTLAETDATAAKWPTIMADYAAREGTYFWWVWVCGECVWSTGVGVECGVRVSLFLIVPGSGYMLD